MPKLRYGLIGASARRISGEHVGALLQLEDVEIAALCDVNEAHMQAAADLCPNDPKLFTDYRQLLDEDLDAVVISVPNFLHEEVAVAAFEAGKHVFCEKPLARTVAECDAIIEASQASGKILQIGFEMRYTPVLMNMVELKRAGQFGDVVLLWSQEFRHDWNEAGMVHDHPKYGTMNWRHSQELSGGSLVEKVTHDFDAFNWIAESRPARVSAMGGTDAYEGRDTLDNALVIIEYENGVRADLQLSVFTPHGFPGRYMGLIGTDGSYKVQYKQSAQKFSRWEANSVTYTFKDNKDPRKGEILAAGGHGASVIREHIAFRDCLLQGTSPQVSSEAGKLSVAIAEAAEMSIREKRMVEIAELM